MQTNIYICGRLMALRGHGGSTFGDLSDFSGKVQILYKRDVLEDKYKLLKSLDVGDFLQVSGTVFLTQKGEKTLEVKDFKFLAKSLRPLPEKWHGIKDEEERYRRRYLDFIMEPKLREMFVRKNKFWQSCRQFLVEQGFMEVETPVLEATPGGADAEAFQTRHKALGIDLYLRISMGELWQKRLMVASFDKTFEIGRQFRNEGIDAEHLQD